jgi:mannitol/fructose-specific phosphotransferase system IIA component
MLLLIAGLRVLTQQTLSELGALIVLHLVIEEKTENTETAVETIEMEIEGGAALVETGTVRDIGIGTGIEKETDIATATGPAIGHIVPIVTETATETVVATGMRTMADTGIETTDEGNGMMILTMKIAPKGGNQLERTVSLLHHPQWMPLRSLLDLLIVLAAVFQVAEAGPQTIVSGMADQQATWTPRMFPCLLSVTVQLEQVQGDLLEEGAPRRLTLFHRTNHTTQMIQRKMTPRPDQYLCLRLLPNSLPAIWVTSLKINLAKEQLWTLELLLTEFLVALKELVT